MYFFFIFQGDLNMKQTQNIKNRYPFFLLHTNYIIILLFYDNINVVIVSLRNRRLLLAPYLLLTQPIIHVCNEYPNL